MTTHAVPEARDGRRARRDRNRDAVVDALLELYDEGALDPTVAEVAERSGVSHRSVFRYFEDNDALARAALARKIDRVGHLLQLDGLGEGLLGTRIDQLVDRRLALYEVVAPSARVARLRAPFVPGLQDDLADTRRLLRDQVAAQFAPELKGRPAALQEALIDSIDALLSFENREVMIVQRGRSRDRAAAILTEALHRLLG